MKRVVSTGTQGNYNNHNIDLIICLYDSENLREELLRYWMVDWLVDDYVKDMESKQMISL